MDYLQLYENWMSDARLSEEARREMLSLSDAEKEYRFGAELEFGTAGMRGIIGYGVNMMNVYTVRRATQGLAAYIGEMPSGAKERGVVISYDTRRCSRLFAEASAAVLAKNGIRAYLFDRVHPVPMLSFAVRRLHAAAGIMITASHNPKEYNGYKVYGEDGAQLSPESSAVISRYIRSIDDFLSVEGEQNSPLIRPVPKEVDEAYFDEIASLSLSPEAVKACGKDLKLVYTPVHGSGYVPVTTILKRLGINATVVEEQVAEDPEFSTVEIPNPEFKETLSLGIALANKIKADVVFGTDPDSDRLGVAVKNDEGEFVALSGNQVGILLLDYILTRLKERGELPENSAVVSSFVSTGMAQAVCESFGVAHIETPVGFKFIGEKIKEWEANKKYTFVFGFEESCGYLHGTHARDKDAVVASMVCAEMVCYYAYIGKTVYARLREIYAKYGFTQDKNISIKYGGLHAMEEMNAVVGNLKGVFAEEIGGMRVLAVRDYSVGERRAADGSRRTIDIPKCNCIYYELEGGSFVCVRPSGTEPKLKIYYSIRAKDEAAAETLFSSAKEDFSHLLEEAKERK